MAGPTDGQGLIARVGAALRYAATGAMPSGWFGPGEPLVPQAPPEVRGRQFDYPTVFNVSYRPRSGEKITFDALKRFATHPIVAMLIQRQKDKVSAMDWHIVPVADVVADATMDTAPADPMIQMITDFFKSPDKEHDWVQWISGVLDQLMVIDAVTVYAAPTRSGDLYALQLLDGAMIKPIIDLGGRRPLAPAPAFQQAIKGLPAIDYSADELVYFPQVYRPDHVYGYSRIEQAHDLIRAAISRLKSQNGYFDFGNIGDGYFTAPEGWNTDSIIALEAKFNAMMQGDPAVRRNAPMLPAGTDWHPTKVDVLSDSYDEFLVRLLCFPFGVAPTPFMKQVGMGHGSAGTDHDAAEEGGVAPLMQYVCRLMTTIIGKWFGRPDLQFAFVEDREFDPAIKSAIEDTRLRNGTLTINGVRARNGEPPIEGGDDAMIYLPTGPVLVKNIAAAAEATALAAKNAADAAANPPAPVIQPAGAAPAAKELTKAADAAVALHLKIVLGAYLGSKGKSIGKTLAGQLVKAAMDDHSARIESALDDIDWSWDDLPGLVQPFIAGIAVGAGADAAKELGSSLFDADTLKRVSARATQYAHDRAAEMVGMKWDGDQLVTNPDATWSISETTRKQLRSLVEKAMDEGQTNTELAKSIAESTLFGSDRADNIARTETALADIRGAASGWIESGVVHSAQFDASPDCCEECQDEDGTIVPLADPEDLDLPHPSCRCSFSAVLDDDDDTNADAKGDDDDD